MKVIMKECDKNRSSFSNRQQKELNKISRKNLLEIVLLQSKTNESLTRKINKINKSKNTNTKKNKVKKIAPTSKEAKQALNKENYKIHYKKILKSTILSLISVVAISILIASLLFPVLQVCGSSMNPTLKNEDIILSVKQEKFGKGDIVAFYYNNKVLVKRVIAVAGDWVEIDKNGNVFVNYELIDEPYVTDKSPNNCKLKFPYQVPDNSYFVLGDARENSVDSCDATIGSISGENIVGKIFFRLWPLNKIGGIK